jgi:nucleoside-diphosphate-sugar epimerase
MVSSMWGLHSRTTLRITRRISLSWLSMERPPFSRQRAKNPRVQRIVLTSSFASVVDIKRRAPHRFTYTAADWNPQSYEESIDPQATPVVAYRGLKKFAELAARDFVDKEKPSFALVTLCPPMTFGPTVHPLEHMSKLNESDANLWQVAQGGELPVARVPFWVDARNLAEAHVEALLRPEARNKRSTLTAPSKIFHQLAAEIIKNRFEWAKVMVTEPETPQ